MLLAGSLAVIIPTHSSKQCAPYARMALCTALSVREILVCPDACSLMSELLRDGE